jgi:hypothetical protein
MGQEAIRDKLPSILNALGQNKFIAGDDLTWLDFLFLETIYHMEFSEPGLLTIYPVLVAYKQRITSLPGLKEYLEKPDCPDGDWNGNEHLETKQWFTNPSQAISDNMKFLYSVKHFEKAQIAGKTLPEQLLTRISPCDSTDSKPIFKGLGWNPKEEEIPVPPEGFRYVYADEVFQGSTTFDEMQK